MLVKPPISLQTLQPPIWAPNTLLTLVTKGIVRMIRAPAEHEFHCVFHPSVLNYRFNMIQPTQTNQLRIRSMISMGFLDSSLGFTWTSPNDLHPWATHGRSRHWQVAGSGGWWSHAGRPPPVWFETNSIPEKNWGDVPPTQKFGVHFLIFSNLSKIIWVSPISVNL